jgi:hypothetical protein
MWLLWPTNLFLERIWLAIAVKALKLSANASCFVVCWVLLFAGGWSVVEG